MLDFYIVSSFFYKKSKQERVPTFVWLFRDDATAVKGPRCDEGTKLRLRDFAVVQLMPTREMAAMPEAWVTVASQWESTDQLPDEVAVVQRKSTTNSWCQR